MAKTAFFWSEIQANPVTEYYITINLNSIFLQAYTQKTFFKLLPQKISKYKAVLWLR